jgi:hypothetical protein
MDRAKCTLDNIEYLATDFEALSNDEIASKRQHLICIECLSKAFFRRKLKSGQAACFGARPHKDDCTQKSQDSGSTIGELSENDKQLINDGSEIDVDFNYGTLKSNHVIENNSEVEASGSANGKKHSSINGIGNAKSQRRLSSLLSILISSNRDSFIQSNKIINVNGYKYLSSNLFKNIESLKSDYVGKFVAVWGVVDRIGLQGTSIWLNSAQDTINFGILVKENERDELFLRYNDIEELVGSYILCFGFLEKSKNDKLYMVLKDISYITFK